MDKPKLKIRLPGGKAMKLLAIVVGLAVAGGGFLLLRQPSAPPAPPPMSAKQAMQAARAKLAAESKKPHAPVRHETKAITPEAPVVPAPAMASTAGQNADHGAPQSVTVITPASPIAIVQSAPSTSAPAPATAHAAAAPAASADATHEAEALAEQSGRDYTAYYNGMGVLSRTVKFLEMKAKIADLQRKIDGTDNSNSSTSGSATMSAMSPVAIMPPPNMPAPKAGAPTSAEAVMPPADMGVLASRSSGPSLQSVMNVGGHYQAVVSTHGADLTVQEGSPIGDGWTVRSIRSTSVTLAKGRKSKTLSIGD